MSGADRISAKAESFTESVIREMTRLCLQAGGVNLAQGFPDFACPPELKAAAKAAIDADVNQYAITWGAREFRSAIAEKVGRTYPGWTVDPERRVARVYRHDGSEKFVTADGALDGEDVLPGFSCPLVSIL